MPSVSEASPPSSGRQKELSFPRKRESTAFIKEWIPDQVGDDSRIVIPECIYRESRAFKRSGSPIRSGMTKENPGFRIKCGMTNPPAMPNAHSCHACPPSCHAERSEASPPLLSCHSEGAHFAPEESHSLISRRPLVANEP